MTSLEEAETGLTGYRALDLTDEKGFLCGKILADLGADVIKVERPGGDPSRKLGPFYRDEPDPEKSLLWWAFNTSKRGITLHIENRDGRETLLNLVKKTDFVIESFPPGYMAKLGLSYEELSHINPGIILISISGFGQDGPYANYKAPDIVCMAMGGYMNLVGDPDRAPLRITIPQAYLHASSEAAAGGLIALWYREMTGKGQWVDVSAQESVALATFDNQIHWELSKINLKRRGGQREVNRINVPLIFRCKDGYVVCLVPGGVTRTKTRRLVGWMDEEGAANDLLKGVDWETFGTDTQPPEQTLEIVRSFEPFLQTKTKNELFEQAVARGFLLAPVNSVKDTVENVQLRARDFWQTVEHPELGKRFIYPGAPYKTKYNTYYIRRRAPLIGEHNDEVFQEMSALSENKTITTKKELQFNSPAEAFKGLKVIDFSWNIVGPATTRYFSDHGATVVRVESPQHYDNIRFIRPYKDGMPGVDRSGYFANYNINKLGITLDLQNAEGMSLAKRLIAWADILVESFSPGVMKRLGLDYDSIKELNSDLIYISTSQLGQTGPHQNYAGFGVNAAAIAGFDDVTGWPDRKPCGVFESYTDCIGPRFLLTAAVEALIYRKKTGKGRYIDQSQLESSVQFLSHALLQYTANGRITTRYGNRDLHAAPHGAYRCAGKDRWCVITISTDEEWQALCQVIGKPALAKDARFTTLTDRKQNEDALDRLIEAWTSRLPPDNVMNQLQQVNVAAGVVETAEDMHNEPQFKYRNHYLTFDHPVIGKHTVDALPFRLSKTPAKQYSCAPCFGEHNAYVCTKLLGMSDEEFVRLVGVGAFS